MNSDLEKNKYVVLRDVLDQSVKDILANYVQMKFFTLKDYEMWGGCLTPEFDAVQPYSKARYADTFTEALMQYYTSKISEVSGKELAPTYSYLRYYERGQWLIKHSDRPACQYSITLPLFVYDEDEDPWEIFVEGSAVKLSVGDMLIYKGCEAQHWREPYQGTFQVQAHFHYVDTKDPAYQAYKFDERNCIGSASVRGNRFNNA